MKEGTGWKTGKGQQIKAGVQRSGDEMLRGGAQIEDRMEG